MSTNHYMLHKCALDDKERDLIYDIYNAIWEYYYKFGSRDFSNKLYLFQNHSMQIIENEIDL